VLIMKQYHGSKNVSADKKAQHRELIQ